MQRLAARDKHDGFRVIVRKNAAQVKLYSRPGNDLTYRFPLIAETLACPSQHGRGSLISSDILIGFQSLEASRQAPVIVAS
jgi:ATP-dependent DNA ligase